jgi:hypothetical protein
MDDIVLRAMAKWPNVPAVHGWLSLDRRGQWLLRGEPIGNEAARRFISRNYGRDDAGRWYFQNGPQKVYVALAYLPWVYVVDEAGELATHTGARVERVERAFIDEDFALVLLTEHGPGLVSDRDLATVSEWLAGPGGEALDDAAIERAIDQLGGGKAGGPGARLGLAYHRALAPVEAIRSDEAAERFGFEPDPQAFSEETKP